MPASVGKQTRAHFFSALMAREIGGGLNCHCHARGTARISCRSVGPCLRRKNISRTKEKFPGIQPPKLENHKLDRMPVIRVLYCEYCLAASTDVCIPACRQAKRPLPEILDAAKKFI